MGKGKGKDCQDGWGCVISNKLSALDFMDEAINNEAYIQLVEQKFLSLLISLKMVTTLYFNKTMRLILLCSLAIQETHAVPPLLYSLSEIS